MATQKSLNPFFRIKRFLWADLMAICIIVVTAAQDQFSLTPALPTVTVRGFLNFKTTVDGTVIVFTPASELPPTTELKISTSAEAFSSSDLSTNAFLQKNLLNSKEGMHEDIQDIMYASPPQNSLEPIKTHAADVNVLGNKIRDPFLQHISDNAVLPSARQINNDLDKMRKLQSSQNQYPTGLVTVLGGTFVERQSTTIFQTRVIGTYIDGKYAQILQSTSHIVASPSPMIRATPVINFSATEYDKIKDISEYPNSILKNLPPSVEDPTDVFDEKEESLSFTTAATITSRTEILPAFSSGEIFETTVSLSKLEPPSTTIHVLQLSTTNQANKVSSSSPVNKSELKSALTTLKTSFLVMDGAQVTDSDFPTQSLTSAKRSSMVGITSSLITVSSTLRLPDEDSTIAAIHKNSRNNVTRTRFLSPRRPSQTVRLNRFKVKLTLRQDSPDEYNVTLPADEDDIEEDHSNKSDEDLDVTYESIGAAADPAKVVFQQTTITSEVTLHVGRRKSVRTLTITTSIPLTVHPTDIQSILSSQSTSMPKDEANNDLSHHVVTRTFTTTERALKTSIVPIFDGKSTMYHTVTESFFIMKLITAYRTLPPGEPTILESFLDGPEILVTTLEAAANAQSSFIQTTPLDHLPAEDRVQPSTTVPSPVNQNPQLANPLLSFSHALSNNPLAAVYLGLQQLNAQMTLYSTFTDVSTYTTTETMYNTKTVRFYDGRSTRYRLISEPISTKKSTVTTTVTSVQPYLNTHALQQQQQLQKLIAATQLSPLQPQYNTITSTYTTTTTTTSLSTRIYTLIYNGFSTKFRTVTSTTLYPTTVTVTSTTKVPVSHT